MINIKIYKNDDVKLEFDGIENYINFNNNLGRHEYFEQSFNSYYIKNLKTKYRYFSIMINQLAWINKYLNSAHTTFNTQNKLTVWH